MLVPRWCQGYLQTDLSAKAEWQCMFQAAAPADPWRILPAELIYHQKYQYHAGVIPASSQFRPGGLQWFFQDGTADHPEGHLQCPASVPDHSRWCP